MKIPVELIDQIIKGRIEDKWDYFKTLDKFEEKDMEQVKFGIKIKFDIRYLFVETAMIKVKDKEGKVLIGRQPYKREDYWDELDAREKIMVEAIMDNMETKNILQGRE